MVRFKEAWMSAVKAISILRTSFHFIPELGSWSQIVHSSPPDFWNESKLHGLEILPKYAERVLTSHGIQREDNLSSPPIRLEVLEVITGENTTDRLLLLILHHALYDGISIGKLIDLVTSIYLSQQNFTSPTVQFHNLLGYFRRQELYGTSFWVKYLENYQYPHIKKDVNLQSIDSSVLAKVIDVDLTQLDKRCKVLLVTTQCFGQVAWAMSLAKFIHTNDVVFGHVVSGRQLPSFEDVIGPMLVGSEIVYRL